MIRVKQNNLEISLRLTSRELLKKDIERQCTLAGASYRVTPDRKYLISLALMNEVYNIYYPQCRVISRDSPQREINPMKKLILLRYLNNAKETAKKEETIGFNQLPSGSFYAPAFSQRVVKPFVTFFGGQTQKLKWAAYRLGGIDIPFGDVGVRISFLPRVSISFVIWKGDDEFLPEGSILFNSNITSYLSTEGVVIASEMVSNKLKSIILKENKDV